MLTGKFGTHSEETVYPINKPHNSYTDTTVVPPKNSKFKMNDDVLVLSTGETGSVWMFSKRDNIDGVMIKLDTQLSLNHSKYVTVPISDAMLVSEWDGGDVKKGNLLVLSDNNPAKVDQYILHAVLEATEKGFQMHKQVRVKETGNMGTIIAIQTVPSLVFVAFTQPATILRVRYQVNHGFSIANFAVEELEVTSEKEETNYE